MKTLKLKTKDKKAWLRIVEAFIAVLIVLSFLLIAFSLKTSKNQEEGEVLRLEKHILDKIVQDDVLREKVLENNVTAIENVAKDLVPVYYNYSIKICRLGDICVMNFSVSSEVYVSQVAVVADLENYDPKILKIFFWKD